MRCFKYEKYRDEFYKIKNSTIHANMGCSVEQNTEHNGNMHTFRCVYASSKTY